MKIKIIKAICGMCFGGILAAFIITGITCAYLNHFQVKPGQIWVLESNDPFNKFNYTNTIIAVSNNYVQYYFCAEVCGETTRIVCSQPIWLFTTTHTKIK